MPNKPFIPNNLKLCTADQSRQMDKNTIEKFGIDGFTLMEIAASKAALHLQKKLNSNKNGLYVCGKGNNGGDGLAVARYLVNEANHRVTIFMAMGAEDLSPDAKKNYSLLKKMSGNGSNITFAEDFKEITLTSYDYIIDAIFGTGLSSKVRSPLSQIIESINDAEVPVFSMDVPSGLNADDGTVHGICIEAAGTFTFGSNKMGFYLNSSDYYTGEITFVDLPFPDYIRKHEALLINKSLGQHLPEKVRKAKHKYDDGVVHILAGSEGLTGAAMMSAQSAWKQGAGAVILYTPKKLLNLYEISLPQVIKIGLGDDDNNHLQPEFAPDILDHLHKKEGILLIGPGLGNNAETGECLEIVLNNYSGKVVLDADALHFWKNFDQVPKTKKKKWIITPHIGEATSYLNAEFKNESERLLWAKDFSEKNNCSLLLKGNPCIFASVSGEIYLTGYNTEPFARAGFGDVLAGTIAAKLATNQPSDIAIIHSLLAGYEKYCSIKPETVFGPEHML